MLSAARGHQQVGSVPKPGGLGPYIGNQAIEVQT